ncbi:uncharacterized protein Z520_04333 [Fonsecaea multimorphosa CBS 102226]|uniref:Cyclin-like domain-containing protein n=1 Tax=Fonsecaea multimorphosa CBS 102226 TaxID=1442371 RepID=A0A0D2KSJ2_9EURO|nr:uncharacterized protein Z520_04333 [Fonsecaea multimorphosa CBS 102226]KIX99698.1 hypothetical protein Z520_04333 [Fonsecaea multimorphosa CBS 102226]OAL26748.1 hypothetical protein AYO22_04101 [Fonsecaea multimorphosa]
MILDDAYRKSTQYRQWSYTQEKLAEIRQNTNDVACIRLREKARIAVAAESTQTSSDEGSFSHGREGVVLTDGDIQTLKAEEELKIVDWACMKIIEVSGAMEPRIPSNITATAIQYLRRFYLTNSPMIHHPKQLVPCALYLATKADHLYLPLSKFIDGLEGVSEESIKARESVLLQGLRFALDVRHPMKGLVGGCIEMHAMAEEGRLGGISKATGFASRIDSAADQAKKLLVTAAQMTDAYFLYTPSQIWLAALTLADRELTETYLERKLADLASPEAAATESRTKLVSTISACARLLESYRLPDPHTQRKELRRIRRKLDICQNLAKVDIEASPGRTFTSMEGEGEGGDYPGRPTKRRKLEVEISQEKGDSSDSDGVV